MKKNIKLICIGFLLLYCFLFEMNFNINISRNSIILNNIEALASEEESDFGNFIPCINICPYCNEEYVICVWSIDVSGSCIEQTHLCSCL